MNFYCPRCRFVFESTENRCNTCGKKKLKQPKDNDVVYLTSRRNGIKSGMLEDILAQNNIPFLRQGTGIPTAVFARDFGDVLYFVPFATLERAKELESIVLK